MNFEFRWNLQCVGFHVFQMAVDTIFLCFCEDSDRNDGENRPYFMSVGLMVRKVALKLRTRCVSRHDFATFDSIPLFSSNFCPTVRRL